MGAEKEASQVNLKGIVFDFDGVVVDTMPAYTQAAVVLWRRYYGLPARVAEIAYWATAGVPFEQQCFELFGDRGLKVVAEAFEQEKRQVLLTAQIFPDVIPVLIEMKQRGIERGVCSSTRGELLLEVLHRYSLVGAFNWVSGIESGPKALQIQECVEHWGGHAPSVVFVGDSPRDSKIARAVRTKFALILRHTEYQFGYDAFQPILSLDQLL